MGCIYRYTDKTDGIIKYVGIVWSDNRSLAQRVKEHKKEPWYKNGDWEIEYSSKHINSRLDAELLEAYYISLYGTKDWYNISKADWGTCSLFDNIFLEDSDWKVFEDKKIYSKRSNQSKSGCSASTKKKWQERERKEKFLDFITPYWKASGEIMVFNFEVIESFFNSINLKLDPDAELDLFGEMCYLLPNIEFSFIKPAIYYGETFGIKPKVIKTTQKQIIVTKRKDPSGQYISPEIIELIISGKKLRNNYETHMTIKKINALWSDCFSQEFLEVLNHQFTEVIAYEQ